jgi:hypothetical protein
MPVQEFNARQVLGQTRLESRPKTALYAFKENIHPTKTSNLGSLQQTIDNDNLCGILLCCAE